MEQRSGPGCERCRTWEEDMYWKHFSSVHFYQFLPKDFHHHLALPKKFAENMMAKLPQKVSLRGPSAAMWDVELKKTNNIEIGGDGWKEFVKAYNLKQNDLLMFKYKQNLSFEVLIFDHDSFCEKEASYFVKQCSQAKPVHENEKKRTVTEAFSMEVSEDEDFDDDEHDDSEFVVSKKSKNIIAEELGRRKNPPRTPRKGVLARAPRGRGRLKRTVIPSQSRSKSKAQSEKKLEQNGVVYDMVEKEPGENGAAKEQSHVLEQGQNTSENGGSVLGTAQSQKSAKKTVRPKRTPANSSRRLALQNDSADKFSKEYKSNRRLVTEAEKENALNGALQKLTENGFIAVMRPSAVYKRFYLNIPVGWMNKCLLRRSCDVVLRMGEKTWLSFFYRNSRGWGGLTTGWKRFAVDNNLEEYDACLFILASQKDDPEIVMDVEIFRVVPDIVPLTPVSQTTPVGQTTLA